MEQNSRTNPQYGYYVTKDSQQVFGKRGDFITSPDISQMFGELVGVWALSAYQSMGAPNKINFVELGAGQGTLIKDILRISRVHFRKFYEAMTLHFVERSPELRIKQAKEIGCNLDDSEITNWKTESGHRFLDSSSTKDGLDVRWHQLLDSVESDQPSIFLAHEFFDALPVHQFEVSHPFQPNPNPH